MTIKPESEVREIYGITPHEIQLIKSFMQGAVYSWVKNRKDEPFAVRDLVGGENYDWTDTPLFCLWEKHIKLGKLPEAAENDAAKDLGWITKSVLKKDKRTFKVEKQGLVNTYLWVDNES
jgi:hypothetical protein